MKVDLNKAFSTSICMKKTHTRFDFSSSVSCFTVVRLLVPQSCVGIHIGVEE